MRAAIPIVVFLRAPIPGRAKTRLAAAIGAERAAALAEAFALDTVARCGEVPGLAPELHADGPLDHPLFAALAARAGLAPAIAQEGGALGERMHRSLARARRAARTGDALLVGTDGPTLPATVLTEAAAAIREGAADLVLTPTADGGFVLIGTSARAPTDFLGASGLRWSSPHALADTVRAARTHGLRVHLTSPHYDVDAPDDLRLLAAHLALDPAAAPETARLLLGRRRAPPF